ncbi:MAG TPA: serine/threonine-protein kinase [Polyangiaceae bacterium]|nr:serine/threonine-protein kinase [Polyangiaceae bacterium]
MKAPSLTVSCEERMRLAEARVGQLVLGKWRLNRLIGLGGMAAVFEATHHNGNRVAIKILHPDLTCFEEIRERFLAEGYAANRVSHPAVVAVRDEGTTEDGAVFLVMDLLCGRTLAERLQRSGERLGVREVLEIASQLLDVLVQAHDRGIVHRDIKPENVFLTHDGRVRLLDFGIARVEANARTHGTELGATLGTAAFMPPEQALGRWTELDGRSDLWALGATMYLLLSGAPVRQLGSVTEQLLGAMTLPVPSLGDAATLPRAVVKVVDRALAFDRDDRFPDARSMQLAIRAAQDELGEPGSQAMLPPPSLEPVALSLRTPQPARRARSSSPAAVHAPTHGTMRPVAASMTPLPELRSAAQRSALPIYLTAGFAVGISIVVLARLNVHTPPGSSALPERASAVLAAPAADPSAAAPLGSTSAPASSAAPRPESWPVPSRTY